MRRTATLPDGGGGRLEAFLLERLPPVERAAVEVRDLIEALAKNRSLLSAEAIARQAGHSLRTLQRLFRRYAGVSPKWVVGRYRLHEALERLAADPGRSLAQLALDLGYTDQPHFSRDFKALIGVSAKTYAAGLL